MLTKPTIDTQDGDREIWDSFKNGDAEAFGILYCRYFGILLKNCFRFSDDETLIKDCIHDLFLEIWKNKLNLDTPRSVKAYLLCSTQRKIFREIRKSRRTPGNMLEFLNGAPVVYSIEEKIIGDQHRIEHIREIGRLLGLLTRRQKEAVSLRFYHNMAYPQIAERMGISTASVYNLISKALDQIRIRVSQKGFASLDHLN